MMMTTGMTTVDNKESIFKMSFFVAIPNEVRSVSFNIVNQVFDHTPPLRKEASIVVVFIIVIFHYLRRPFSESRII